MSVPRRERRRQPIRLSETLALDGEQWGFVLLALEDAGWKPPRPRLWYVASGTDVFDEEAENLAKAAGVLFMPLLRTTVWANALHRVNLGVLHKTRFQRAAGDERTY